MNERRSDRALARRLRRADEDAFAELFDGVFPRLFRFAMVRCGGDEEAAKEIVQATLTKAIDRLASFRGEADMFTWICSICRREVADHYRARGRAPDAPLEESPEVRAALAALGATFDDPQRDLERRDVVRLVHATLDHLPPRYGDALELRYLQGLSVRDVAARLELGYKAAESVLSRARAAFREGFAAVTTAAGGAR